MKVTYLPQSWPPPGLGFMRGRSFTLPSWRHGATIFLAPEDYATTAKAILARTHETCHGKQIERDGGLRWLCRYFLSRRWRLEYEAEAFAVSCRTRDSGDPDRWVGFYAAHLVRSYRLRITDEQAAAAIRRWL